MLDQQKIIPAISTHQHLKKFLESTLTYGVLMNFQLAQLEELVTQMKSKGKKVLIHAELIKGLSSDEYGAIYLIQNLGVDGIISSKPKVMEICKKRNVLSIFRFFLKDSLSLEQSVDLTHKINPDYVEVLPATAVDIIELLKSKITPPIMLGGLIQSKAHIQKCLLNGAVAVTTSDPDFWQ
jgi:glycerol uptake operon antiterminator